MSDLTAIYQNICRENDWAEDPDQLRALVAFEDVADQMLCSEQTASPLQFLKNIWPGKGQESLSPHAQGVYMQGGVGRGKTFVMDIFYDYVPTLRKKRYHFYEFMIHVHDHMHQQRQKGTDRSIDADLIEVAEHIAKDVDLLCFDEMFVEDVADAMLLGRLFSALFNLGVYVVFTSNIHPDDLYKDGLQRDRFLPFIGLLKTRLTVISFDGQMDYRSQSVRDHQRYMWPADQDAKDQFSKLFEMLTGSKNASPYTLHYKGRKITLPKAAKKTLWADFDALCANPLGAGDYLALAEEFSTVLLVGIPQLDDTLRNETRRFMALVDTLYEKKIMLFALSAVALDNLYTGVIYKAAFARTMSRLVEMQSPDYPQKN